MATLTNFTIALLCTVNCGETWLSMGLIYGPDGVAMRCLAGLVGLGWFGLVWVVGLGRGLGGRSVERGPVTVSLGVGPVDTVRPGLLAGHGGQAAQFTGHGQLLAHPIRFVCEMNETLTDGLKTGVAYGALVFPFLTE